MSVSRRTLMASAAGAMALGGTAAHAQQTANPSSSIEARLIARALENAHALNFDGSNFSGPGWDLLLREASACEFTLFGEEHGLAEAPILARELFLALRPAEYDTLAIEVSAPIAEDLDRAARHGVEGLRSFYTEFPPGAAFYFWRTEAELLAAARASVPGRQVAIWGLDYEVVADRRLIARLQDKAPRGARAALQTLAAASDAAWETWRTTHNPGAFFTFSGDPDLVRAVKAAWRNPDDDATRILETLEETLEINLLFFNRTWDSNERRARLMRRNFADHLNRADADRRQPKVMVKLGENHVQRGVNWTGNFDVGSLVHEAAELRGGRAFSLLIGGGIEGRHGVLNPTNMSTADAPATMLAEMGMAAFVNAAPSDGPMVLDMRPLRRLLSTTANLREYNNPDAVKNIFAFDVIVTWPRSTAAQMLVTP